MDEGMSGENPQMTLDEIKSVVETAHDSEAVAEELGDALFALVNWARMLHVDPEAALRGANAKFERRFAAMEALIKTRGLAVQGLSAASWEQLWNEVKAVELQG